GCDEECARRTPSTLVLSYALLAPKTPCNRLATCRRRQARSEQLRLGCPAIGPCWGCGCHRPTAHSAAAAVTGALGPVPAVRASRLSTAVSPVSAGLEGKAAAG